MIVISYGMVKSASSFTFQLIQQTLLKLSEENGAVLHSIGDVLPGFKGPFASNADELQSIVSDLCATKVNWECEHVVIKTHSAPTERIIGLMQCNPIKVVLNYRDPAEIALSLRDVVRKEKADRAVRFNRKFEDIAATHGAIQWHAETFISWLATGLALPVYYDDLIERDIATLDEIMEFLGISGFETELTLDKFKSDKGRIWEFNVGVVGRARNEMSKLQLSEFYEKHYHFYSLIKELGEKKGFDRVFL